MVFLLLLIELQIVVVSLSRECLPINFIHQLRGYYSVCVIQVEKICTLEQKFSVMCNKISSKWGLQNNLGPYILDQVTDVWNLQNVQKHKNHKLKLKLYKLCCKMYWYAKIIHFLKCPLLLFNIGNLAQWLFGSPVYSQPPNFVIEVFFRVYVYSG